VGSFTGRATRARRRNGDDRRVFFIVFCRAFIILYLIRHLLIPVVQLKTSYFRPFFDTICRKYIILCSLQIVSKLKYSGNLVHKRGYHPPK
jgi:hypothetical protein